MCILNIFSSCSLDVDNVSENGSPPNHASSHLLPNTSLIPKTLNWSSNSVNSHTSVPVFTVQSPTHTSASPVQSPSHVTPSITSPVKPTFTHSSVSPIQSPSHTRSVTSPVKPSTHSHSLGLLFSHHLTLVQSPFLLNHQLILIHQCLLFSHHLTLVQSPLLLSHQLILIHQCLLFSHHLTLIQSPLLLSHQLILIHQCLLLVVNLHWQLIQLSLPAIAM